MTTALPTTSTDAYRRDARRLRGRYAGQPHRLQPALRVLAARSAVRAVDVRRAADPIPPQLLVGPGPDAADIVRRFIALARPLATGPVLSYADRHRLLRAGERMGLSRFHANLVLASLRHEAGGREESFAPADERSMSRVAPGWLAYSVTALVVQVGILLVGWRFLQG